MVIEVTDNGVPSRSDNTTLNITVLDVNDNPPAFVNLPTDPINVKEVNKCTNNKLIVANGTLISLCLIKYIM